VSYTQGKNLKTTLLPVLQKPKRTMNSYGKGGSMLNTVQTLRSGDPKVTILRETYWAGKSVDGNYYQISRRLNSPSRNHHRLARLRAAVR